MEISVVLIVCFLAILTGCFTGLIPGVHINLVSTLILVNFNSLIQILKLEYLIIFIIVMSLTHSFVDFIPSIVFGVPSADTVLSVLPGHQMILNGEGFKAVYLSAIGSFIGVFTSILVSFMFFWFLEDVYSSILRFIPYLLIVVVISLVVFESDNNSRFWAFLIILFSGGYGLLVMNSIHISNPLLILFSGLFGISAIIFSLKTSNAKLPKQKFKVKINFDTDFMKSCVIGTILASICSITPGIGNIQAASISTIFTKKMKSENLIVLLSVINTVNFIVSIMTFYVINRARNGSVVAISQIVGSITFKQVLLYNLIILISSFVVFFVTLRIGKKVLKFVSRINFKFVNIVILVFLFGVVLFLEGLYGVLLLIGASCLGVITISVGVRRVHLMSALIIPIIFNLI